MELGAEILAFDDRSSELYVIGSGGLSVLDLADPRAPRLVTSWGFSVTEPWEPTSVAVDPLGRGIVAATWIPSPSDSVPGVLQLIDSDRHRVVWETPIGYHPDCVMFTPDGSRLVVANECEPASTDRAGGITIVDLHAVRSSEDLQGVGTEFYGFTPESLGEGVDLMALRQRDSDPLRPELDIEPEYLAATEEGVWVTLQENNAVGYFDFGEEKWTRLIGLGSFEHDFDSSDEDGINIGRRPGVRLLAEPDTVEYFEGSDGRGYLLLANEGEQGDQCRMRLSDAIADGRFDHRARLILDAMYGGDAEAALGGLWISSIDGDLDEDGDIDQPMALGGRNIAILDTQSGALVWDSGSQIEEITAHRWPDQFNAGDSRSNKSGPEPEGLAIGVVDGRTYGFVGLERARAVLMYDLTNPSNAEFVDAVPLGEGYSPEGLAFMTLGNRHYLAVASELANRLTLFEIAREKPALGDQGAGDGAVGGQDDYR
ncbi:MAG: hypothetical protein KC996_10425 [Phycisphaerales bacterium]|nr:hypothetical protein [Phycisphaerales bacterium]